MKVFNDEAALALATLSVDQLVRTKGSGSATDGQTILWRIAASGTGITLANGNVAIALVNDKSGRKNIFYNGDFAIWQRGTLDNFTGTRYVPDRWVGFVAGAGATYQQVPTITGESKFSLEIISSGTTTNSQLIQRLESADIVHIQNSDITISGYVDSTLSRSIDVALGEAKLLDDFSTGTNPIITKTIPAAAGGRNFSLTFTAAEMGTFPNGLAVTMVIDNPANTTVGFDNLQLEKGSAKTDFDYMPIPQQLALCQRYYEKSYDQDLYAGDAANNGYISGVASGSTICQGPRYTVRKHGIPTIVIYNFLTGAVGSVTRLDGGGTVTGVTANNIGDFQTGSIRATTFVANTPYGFHYTADAEL